MASASAEEAILFIGALIVAASIGGVMINQSTIISDALTDTYTEQAEELNTEIEIITDPNGPVYDVNGNNNITIHVKNSGFRTLPADTSVIEVTVDGAYTSQVTVTVLDDPEWGPHTVARLVIDTGTLNAGAHTVRVSVDGDAESFTFRV